MAHITLTKDNFAQEVLHSEKPVLVDFWASAWVRGAFPAQTFAGSRPIISRSSLLDLPPTSRRTGSHCNPRAES